MPAPSNHLKDHIEIIAKHEEEFLERRTTSERVGDLVPFPLLDTMVAIEAIFLASFIVMRQGRLSRRSDEREHLMLQVLILAEKEVTAVLNLQRKLAAKAGLPEQTGNAEIAELAETTSIDDVARTIRESISTD
jgi:uncharacterized membrane protein